MTQSYRAYKMAASCTLCIANVELAIFLCPNPICSSDSEEQMVGRSNATSTKFMRLLKEQINLCAETTAIL